MDEQNFRRLDHLYDYTKFHIGMYVTLIVAVFTLVGIEALKGDPLQIMRAPLAIGTVLFALAGAFGSLVASAIPMTKAKTFDEFMNEKVGTARITIIPVEWAVYIEHIFFWLGVFVLLAGSLAVLYPNSPLVFWL